MQLTHELGLMRYRAYRSVFDQQDPEQGYHSLGWGHFRRILDLSSHLNQVLGVPTTSSSTSVMADWICSNTGTDVNQLPLLRACGLSSTKHAHRL
jgi:hypothetical protein